MRASALTTESAWEKIRLTRMADAYDRLAAQATQDPAPPLPEPPSGAPPRPTITRP